MVVLRGCGEFGGHLRGSGRKAKKSVDKDFVEVIDCWYRGERRR